MSNRWSYFVGLLRYEFSLTLGVPRLYVFSAKGAASLFSLGQRPKICEIPSASAEGAIHFRHEFDHHSRHAPVTQ